MKERDEARGVSQPARTIRERLSYANVMATAAMFVALGGSAWALSRGEVKTKHLANNAVKAKKIANNAVTAPKLACRGNSAIDKMVRAGSVCIDRYEASIWTARTGGTRIIGAIPCNANGQDCTNIYARSVAGVQPRADITWFQAQQALANSGKRLPTNAEWQQAVAGTPDSNTCNVTPAPPEVVNTGANAGCISNHGANDMVGNLWEWVADWDEEGLDCSTWPAAFGSDLTCIGRASGGASTHFPGALIRGGHWDDGADAGPFALAGFRPSFSVPGIIGFRGAR